MNQSGGAKNSAKYQALVDETLDYLASKEAILSVDSDPYWPKWNTPWWRIMTLYEMGLVHLAPDQIIETLVGKIDSHYIKYFPLHESDISMGVDPYRHIPCHCALSTICQAFFAYGVDLEDSSTPFNYSYDTGDLVCYYFPLK